MSGELKPELRHRLPASWTRERRAALISELHTDRRPGRRRWHRRRALLVVPAVAALVSGAIAMTQDTPEIEAVGCYPRADRHATATAFAQDRIDDPIGSCRKEWRAGHVAPTRTTPPLVGCLEGTEARVYPGRGDEVCERLGIDPLPDRFADQARKSGEFRDRLGRRLKGCPTIARAKEIAREELDRAGRRSWEVRIRPDQGEVARIDCIDSFGILEVPGEPTRVELDYPVKELSAAEQRRVVKRMRRETCAHAREGDDVDAALAATECRYDNLSKCIRPRLAAAELRRQLTVRDEDHVVKVAFDAPDRCWSGISNKDGTITVLSQAREPDQR